MELIRQATWYLWLIECLLCLVSYSELGHSISSQKKGDIQRAEEYYSRAILLDPGDGEIMSQYAKLVWELHGDEERATSYFERAVQAAPQDSHVLASYAGFLWETDEDCVGELGDGELHDYVGSFQHETLACAT